MRVLVEKITLLLFLGFSLTLILLPRNVQAYSFDFSGTVLFDSKASSNCLPGFGDSFTGSLSLDDDLLNYTNVRRSTSYDDFGGVTGGYFSQGKQDFFYAFSQGEEASSQMGMIWWSDSRNFKINGLHLGNVYGLVFYLEGSTVYTPGQLIALRLTEYMANGFLPTLTGRNQNPHYLGCQVLDGEAFFGVIQDPFIAAQSSSAVPLPASVWFLGSGLLFLVRRRKK